MIQVYETRHLFTGFHWIMSYFVKVKLLFCFTAQLQWFALIVSFTFSLICSEYNRYLFWKRSFELFVQAACYVAGLFVKNCEENVFIGILTVHFMQYTCSALFVWLKSNLNAVKTRNMGH